MNNNFLIICLAGKGTRFLDAGYKTPKFFLPIKGSLVISLIIEEIKLSFTGKIILVVNDFYLNFDDTFFNLEKKYNLEKTLYIKDTNGQAETATIALNSIKSTLGSFALFNGDTIIKNRNLDLLFERIQINSLDGLIDCFNSISNKYSYIKYQNNIVLDIVEKKVISNYATSGLYLFSSKKDFLNAFNCIKKDKEIYISSIYKELISNKKKFTFNLEENKNNTIVLGTPRQYVQFIKNKK